MDLAFRRLGSVAVPCEGDPEARIDAILDRAAAALEANRVKSVRRERDAVVFETTFWGSCLYWNGVNPGEKGVLRAEASDEAIYVSCLLRTDVMAKSAATLLAMMLAISVVSELVMGDDLRPILYAQAALLLSVLVGLSWLANEIRSHILLDAWLRKLAKGEPQSPPAKERPPMKKGDSGWF